ncbi:MAG: hypothetical protein Q9207_007318, partial [Kuettlingeria erythrocarpa]
MSDNPKTDGNDNTNRLGGMGHYILSSNPGPLGQRLRAIIFVAEDNDDTESSVPRFCTLRDPSDEQLVQFFNHPQTSYFPPTTHISAMQDLGAVTLPGSSPHMDVEAWKDYPQPWTDKSQPPRFFSGIASAPGEDEAPRRDGKGRFTHRSELDGSDPEHRGYRGLDICVFELNQNSATEAPDISKPIPCYLLTNPSLTEMQTFWYDPGRAEGMASYAVMEQLGAQYFWDFRESRATESMFHFLHRDTSRNAVTTIFCYDDPRVGVWTLRLEGERLKGYEEALKSGRAVPPTHKLFEELGGRYHAKADCQCPELEL